MIIGIEKIFGVKKRLIYHDRRDALETMKSLINMAYDIGNNDNLKAKSELAEEYSLVRDGAIILGADVNGLPKRINYNSIRRIETPEEIAERKPVGGFKWGKW